VAGPGKDNFVRRTLAIVTTLISAAAGLLISSGVASADPSAAAWQSLRQCESSGRYDINTGNGYYGAYQFDLSTWRSVGGTGYPNQASPAEQDYRALYLYRMRGWQPWTCARIRGLTEDGDARSRVVPPYPGSGSGGTTTPPSPPGTGSSGASGAPAYPGRQFQEGDYSEDLKVWQRQLGGRGFGLVGTGYFGPKTAEVVKQLQRDAGLVVDGVIGRQTWDAAWSSGSTATPVPAPGPSDSCSIGATTAPAWPGVTFNPGDTSTSLQCWQKQMGSRGYGLVGTGYYGPATKAVVLGVQARNGLIQSGILGPLTWKAAWEGK
jgi:resuscitation-promoting factor RpfA